MENDAQSLKMDTLEPTVEIPPEPQIHESAKEDRLAADIEKQFHQNTSWRSVVFWGVLVAVTLTVALSDAIMVWYMVPKHSDPNPAILSAWFGSTVIQVVGLLAVITRHLFPGAKWCGSPLAETQTD